MIQVFLKFRKGCFNVHFNDRDEIIALTPQWKGERLPDGRPYVPDKYLKQLHKMTLEEVYSNSVRCQELASEHAENEEKLAGLYELWETLAE